VRTARNVLVLHAGICLSVGLCVAIPSGTVILSVKVKMDIWVVVVSTKKKPMFQFQLKM